jgi:hypothetical protein
MIATRAADAMAMKPLGGANEIEVMSCPTVMVFNSTAAGFG